MMKLTQGNTGNSGLRNKYLNLVLIRCSWNPKLHLKEKKLRSKVRISLSTLQPCMTVSSAFLVHEGPINIGLGGTRTTGHLQANMFFSDEPGYYKENAYGIRLETILRVVEKNVTEKPFG